jgi:hypothetical protein
MLRNLWKTLNSRDTSVCKNERTPFSSQQENVALSANQRAEYAYPDAF